LQPHFSNDSYIKYEIFRKLGYRKGVETAFIRLIDCATTYDFIADADYDLEFYIQIRVNSGLGEVYANIVINDTLITSFGLVPWWKRHSFIIPREVLNAESIQNMRIEIGKTKESPIKAQISNSDTYNIWHVIKPLYAEVMTCRLTSLSAPSATR
jgi:hypothetical protein